MQPEQPSHPSRRDFLGTAARAAAIGGLASSVSLADSHSAKLGIGKGPEPRKIGPEGKIRFGCIGIGGRGGGLLDILLKQPNVEVVAIADPGDHNRKRAADKVTKAGGDKPDLYSGEEDYKTKLLVRDDIDAILTATPCYMHGPVYLACFAAGKHFYGEKPMCTEANEADALVEAQKRNPKVVGQIGFQRRASIRYQEAMQRIRDGLIGELIDGRGAWNNSWGPIGRPDEGSRIWLGRRKYSGDWMLEQACHTFDVFCWAADAMPVAASGMGRRDIFKEMDPERDVTDFYHAHLEFPNNFLVDFEHSWFCPHQDQFAMRADGQCRDIGEGRFTGVFERAAGPKGGIDFGTGMFFPRHRKDKKFTIQPNEPGHTEVALQEFLNSIRTGSPSVSGVETGRMATYTALLVRKAVDERRRITMDEFMKA